MRMVEGSPLSHAELREIERHLEEGNTDEAAAGLTSLAHSGAHAAAIDFLTTRLLFQRGRIDGAGAADRLSSIIAQTPDFPEAERWLAELEGRAAPPRRASDPDADPWQSRTPVDACLTPLSEDDDATPPEPVNLDELGREALGPDSSTPPPRPRESRERPGRSVPPARMPFDSLAAKEQLEQSAGRYRASLVPPNGRDRGSSNAASATPGAANAFEARIEAALQEARDGNVDRVRELLPTSATPPGLSAERLGEFARLLLEVGDAERAAREAEKALELAPETRETQLLFAWCAVRYSRQRDDSWALDRAGAMLKRIGPGPAPEPGLLEALRACVEARAGSASLASSMAQRALRVNAEALDALAAMAEAAALMGETAKAETALERLAAVSLATAEQLAPRLARLGVGDTGPTSSASIWLPLEHSLYSGARDAARVALESQALAEVGPFELARLESASAVAADAASFLATAPILRHFGPYDSSLASIPRLEAGLGLLYGHAARALADGGSSDALWQLCGFYLGDTLIRACDGTWQPGSGDLLDACVSIFDNDVAPFQIVRNRLLHGKHARIPAALGQLLDEAPRVAQLYRADAVSAPSATWLDGELPRLDELPRLGRALGHSVVATYCKEQHGKQLDRSLGSLAALDAYLALVTHRDVPLDRRDPWARWLAVLIGAYLGEVLCRELGAVWQNVGSTGADGLGVTVGLRTVAPIAWMLDNLSGELSPLETLISSLRNTSR